jgi:hypothetical protein
MPKKTLWRAAKDDYIDTGYSFAEDEETASAYLDNPGFGGTTLWKARIRFSEDEVLDLTGHTLEQARRLAGVPSSRGAIEIDEWLPREPGVQAAFREQGYLWALVTESYPEGTTTWIWLGTSDDDEPELEEAVGRG